MQSISSMAGRSLIRKSVSAAVVAKMFAHTAQSLSRSGPAQRLVGINAIKSDAYGRAEIDYDKCVSCGMCLVNCPFGAIADKAQIFQLIQSMKQGTPVYAVIAPAFVGQFGPKVTPEKLRAAMKALGFAY